MAESPGSINGDKPANIEAPTIVTPPKTRPNTVGGSWTG